MEDDAKNGIGAVGEVTLHYEFAAGKARTIEWLIGYLIRRLFYYETKKLGRTAESARRSLSRIVTFMSST